MDNEFLLGVSSVILLVFSIVGTLVYASYANRDYHLRCVSVMKDKPVQDILLICKP